MSGVSRLKFCCAADVNDIVKSLQFAYENKLKSSIMGAGHQVVGVQLLPNAVVIDTSNLTAVTVDDDSETAYVEAGISPVDPLQTQLHRFRSNRKVISTSSSLRLPTGAVFASVFPFGSRLSVCASRFCSASCVEYGMHP